MSKSRRVKLTHRVRLSPRPYQLTYALPELVGTMPANILVTGGAGFIASHVVNLLAKKYPNSKVRPR